MVRLAGTGGQAAAAHSLDCETVWWWHLLEMLRKPLIQEWMRKVELREIS
jgi:hypothetical protein